MKRLAWLAAIGVLMVAACSPPPTATPEPTVPEATAAPTATSQPLPTQATGPIAPTSTPELPAREQIVQPQPGDWVRGPETAAVTLIEWGDFQ